MDETKPILCGKCHVEPKFGFERDAEAWASCPNCGQEDRIADIQREATEHYMRKSVDGMFAGLKGTGLTVESPPQRNYRWVTGD